MPIAADPRASHGSRWLAATTSASRRLALDQNTGRQEWLQSQVRGAAAANEAIDSTTTRPEAARPPSNDQKSFPRIRRSFRPRRGNRTEGLQSASRPDTAPSGPMADRKN